MRPGRDHLIASAGEHPSVMRVMDELETRGYAVDRLPLDGRGQVSPAALDAALTPRTALVSVMHVNNETGAVMPIEELGRVIRSKAPDAVFHVDGVQALGRVDCGLPAPDLYSVSGHKIHAPKGVGALLVRPGLLLRPVLLGGGQEEGLRSGTENTPGIRGFGRAAELYRERRERYAAHLRRLKERLARGIAGGLEDVFVNGPGPGEGAPHILNVSFVGLRGEVLLRALEAEGIFVGTGSACSARKRAASPVLIAMGLPPERVDSAIRFSLSPLNTEDEIDAALDALYRTVPRLRRFGRKK
jgi:cysteine desulfurase